MGYKAGSKMRYLATISLGITFSILILFVGTGSGRAVPPTNSSSQIFDDRAILTDFYYATDGPNWLNQENWLSDQPLDTWYGVKTDESSLDVLSLLLSGNGITGEIPYELTLMSRVETINLERNQLHGQIPQIANWSQLRTLNLHRNNLRGEIPPELGQLRELRSLNLRTPNKMAC